MVSARGLSGLARVIAIVAMVSASGCQWVALTPEAEGIRVYASPEDTPAACELVSHAEVEVPDGLWIFGRRTEKVETELETLARNAAAKREGNAIAPSGPVDAGTRRYQILRCP